MSREMLSTAELLESESVFVPHQKTRVLLSLRSWRFHWRKKKKTLATHAVFSVFLNPQPFG